MGRLSDRVGRRAVLLTLAAMSAGLSMTIGWLVAWPVFVLLVLGLLYGFTALGDSPVLSVAITEVVEPGHLGAVLALRALLGFGAGAIAPLAFGAVLDLTGPGSAPPTMWGLAFMTLGLGGLLAAVCAWSVRPARAPAVPAKAGEP
jgi:MFS family permease